MKPVSFLLALILVFQSLLPSCARPGEAVEEVLKRYGLQGQTPYTQDDYIAYKIDGSKFLSQPTLFLKLGAKGVILEQNFLFSKSTVHEKDVQRAKNDSIPTFAIPHQEYLVGDFSELPRESYELWDRVLGVATAPLGAAAGSIVGAGKGTAIGTKLGVQNAGAAGHALGGDASGKAAAWAGSASAVAAGAVTGLFAGLAGGAVEGGARGARFGVEGLSGADRKITGEVAVASTHAVVGGRIGKELTIEEQKDLLNKLTELEQSRLAGGKKPNDVADNDSDRDLSDSGNKNDVESYIDKFDSAKANSDFDNNAAGYKPEDGSGKNVAGMW